jgi:hypothetical protein
LNTYLLVSRNAWRSPEELEEAWGRAYASCELKSRRDVRWLRTYVIDEEDGRLGSICVYEAANEGAIRKHVRRAGLPLPEIKPVASELVFLTDRART